MPATIWQQKCTGAAAVQLFDAAEIRRALAVLVAPEHGFQLQTAPFHGDSFATFAGADLDGATAWTEKQTEAIGIYYALNPVPADLAAYLKVGDVLRRRWLLIDVDRNKEIEEKQSATEAEHETAREMALDVLGFLATKGWPAPLLVDSGNGWHLLYRIDLENDAGSRVLLRQLLKGLAARLDGPRGAIGAECHDARRIAKLPGTRACRGVNTEERPWRSCRLLNVPQSLEIVSAEQLAATAAALHPRAGHKPEPEPPRPEVNGSPFVLRTGTDREKAYVRKALASQCSRIALSRKGDRNNELFRSAAAMGNFVGAGLLDEKEVFEALLDASKQAGCDNPWKDGDTLRRGMAEGKLTPRYPPQQPAGASTGQKEQAEQGPPAGEMVIVRASAVKPTPIEWLWPGKILRSKLTTFAGQTGQGKTFVTCDIMARVSTGTEWPDGKGECAPGGQVLFISGDDDMDDTIVPRLIALEADLDRVCFLTEKVQADWSLAALKTLDAALEQMGAAVSLVVIDPPTSFLAGVDDHKNSELRAVLTPLKDWAKRQRVAVILITHVNKGGAAKTEAMMRVMGSVAWVSGVRAAYMFAPDPGDADRQLFVPLKNNLGPKGKGLAYRIVNGSDGIGRVEWLGEVDTTADEAMGKERRPRQILATEWLVGLFREKLEWSSDEFWGSARANNISRDAVFEARVKLNLPKPRKERTMAGDITWTWWVPPDWPPLHESKPAAPSPADEAESCPFEGRAGETAF